MNAMRHFLLPALLVLSLPAGAQTLRYPVKSMDFDIWCTEVKRLAWERCDKRQPEDMAEFEKLRAIVEHYEIPYYKQKENALRFDTDILHHDPVDKRPDDTLKRPPSALADKP